MGSRLRPVAPVLDSKPRRIPGLEVTEPSSISLTPDLGRNDSLTSQLPRRILSSTVVERFAIISAYISRKLLESEELTTNDRARVANHAVSVHTSPRAPQLLRHGGMQTC